MDTLKVNDFTAGWIPGQDLVRGQKTGLTRMDNLMLDEYGALTIVRGTRLVNPDTFASGIQTIYSRFDGTKLYRYVCLANGEVISDDGAGAFSTAVIFEGGEGSGIRAAFKVGFGFVFVVSGTRSRKIAPGDYVEVNLGVQTPPNPPDSQKSTLVIIPDSYDVVLNEEVTKHEFRTLSLTLILLLFVLTLIGHFLPKSIRWFSDDNFGTDDDFYIFNVRILILRSC